jgi:hypothetical protein
VSGELWCNLGIKSSSSAFCKQLASDWISDDISALTPEPHDSERLPDTLCAENCKPFCKLIVCKLFLLSLFYDLGPSPGAGAKTCSEALTFYRWLTEVAGYILIAHET